MKPYVLGVALLAAAAACGLLGLALPDGIPAGMANLAMIGLGIAGLANVVTTFVNGRRVKTLAD